MASHVDNNAHRGWSFCFCNGLLAGLFRYIAGPWCYAYFQPIGLLCSFRHSNQSPLSDCEFYNSNCSTCFYCIVDKAIEYWIDRYFLHRKKEQYDRIPTSANCHNTDRRHHRGQIRSVSWSRKWTDSAKSNRGRIRETRTEKRASSFQKLCVKSPPLEAKHKIGIGAEHKYRLGLTSNKFLYLVL